MGRAARRSHPSSGVGEMIALGCDLRLRAMPAQIVLPIALPYIIITYDPPLVQRRPPLVLQREIQEVSRVDLAREMRSARHEATMA
jgi:hypothetical protein